MFVFLNVEINVVVVLAVTPRDLRAWRTPSPVGSFKTQGKYTHTKRPYAHTGS